MQTLLTRQGYEVGKVDGKLGLATRARRQAGADEARHAGGFVSDRGADRAARRKRERRGSPGVHADRSGRSGRDAASARTTGSAEGTQAAGRAERGSAIAERTVR